MRNIILILTAFIVSYQHASAQTMVYSSEKKSRSTLWKVSAFVLTAATTADAASSWGHVETNPLLRDNSGRFGFKAIALKAAITSGVLGTQYLMLRNHPKGEKFTTISNFVIAAGFGAAAGYNYNLQHGSTIPQLAPATRP